MDLNVIMSSPVILICGAGLVLIVGWYIFRTGAESADKQENNENNDTVHTQVEKDIPSDTSDGPERPTSRLLDMKQNFINKIKNLKKEKKVKSKDTDIPNEKPLDQKDSIFGSKLPVKPVQPEISKRAEIPVETSGGKTIEVPQLQNTDYQNEPVSAIDTNENVALNEEPVTMPPAEIVKEPEIVETKPEKSGSGSDIFSMFTDTGGEESEVSKFAANLEPITMDDLMKEIEDLKKHLHVK
jgi:hypothetical protein